MTEPHPSQPPWGASASGVQHQPYGYAGQAPQYPYDQAAPPQYPANGPIPQYSYAPPPAPPQPPRRDRQPLLLGVLAALLVVGGVIGAALAIGGNSRSSTPSRSQGIGIRAGDCYEQPSNQATDFASLTAVSCATRHNAQAFYSFTYPGATAVAPSDDALKATAQPRCDAAAKTGVDQSELPPDAHQSLVFADAATWARGYHDITCVYEGDADSTGSFVKN